MPRVVSSSLVCMLLLLGATATTQQPAQQPADRRAEQPAAPTPGRRLQVLFFGAPTENGPHHDPITRYATLKKALGIAGIDLTYSEDPAAAFTPAAFTPAALAPFDAVLMYGNWSQHEPMRREQLTALLSYVDDGGGFVPVHCASACFGGSPLFVKLVGARFASHGDGVFRVADVAPDHPILRGLDGFEAWDETYVHDQHGDDRTVLQTRDGEPWTWVRQQGRGRVFYTASGHDHRVWDLPAFQQLLRNALLWAVGDQARAELDALRLPVLETEPVSLPGYRERQEITIAQKPLPPAESQKLAQVPIGMELSLFAAEPDIVNPIHVAWDERGRAFVVETIDYPNNLQRGDLGHDRITLCEDTDGDGRADRFVRFAERLSIPTSLCFADGGVLCTNGQDMLFLRDTDGDDVADERRVLFSGFHMGDTHAGVSNLRYGFDGWIWATVGYSGFEGDVGGEHHEFGQAVFRFRPDGSKLEVLQHTTNNTWGLGFTVAGDVVGSTANANPSWYLSAPAAAYRAAGLEQPHTPRADDNPTFFPMSQDIRQVDQFDRYTAAAGHALYTARRFPAEYHDRIAFVCEPTGKLVGQFVMERRGAGFRAVQLPNNLYASADAWSAPVCAEVGPDGAVWICDWYNLIVQHNPTPSRQSAGVDAKTGRGNAYETPLRDTQHGRIWRVFPRDTQDDAMPRLDLDETPPLLSALDHPNLLWRLHAQRLIAEHSSSTAEALAKLFFLRADDPGHGAVHAVHLLELIGQLDDRLLGYVLQMAKDEGARRAAIGIARQRGLGDLVAKHSIRDGTIHADGRELADVLVALATAEPAPAIGAAVFAVAQQHGDAFFDEPAMRDAWTIAARRHATGVLAAAATAGITTAPTAPVNLLPNADFEQLDGSAPADWTDLRTYSGAGRERITVRSATPGRTGGHCLELRCEPFTDSGLAVTIAVEPGARYRLSGWVRTERAEARGRAPGMMLNVHGGPHTRGLTGDNDWTELSLEFEAWEPEVVVHCLFGGYGGARGVAFFDDVSLVKVGGGNTLAGAIESLGRHVAEHPTAVAAEAPSAPVRRFEIDPAVHQRGAGVFQRTCVTCHGIDGKGNPAAFPPLDGSDWLTGEPELPIKVVLHGLMGPVKVGDVQITSAMLPLGSTLNDHEIADVLTYCRQRWSNDAAPVTAEQVQAVRAATKTRVMMWTAAELGR